MKKAGAIFTVFFFIFSSSVAFAQMPMGVSGVMPAVSAAPLERVGVVAAAHGNVELKMPGQAGRIASSGQPIFIGDEVKTDAAGQLQILLLDETVFTIGPNSSITIDQFVYDPKSHDGLIQASVATGVFRYVSGKIAAKRPDRVSVKLPTATIGFRGTIVGGSVGEGGQGIVALLGPGNHNDAGVRNGSFSIDGLGHHHHHHDVNRTGFGVTVGANGTLSGVFRLSDAQLNGLTQGMMSTGNRGHGLGGSGQGSGQGGGNGSQGGALNSGNVGTLSGETGAITAANSSFNGNLTNLTSSLNNTSIQSSQSASNANGQFSAADGLTTLEQLTRITTGTGYYDVSGVFVSGSTTGTMSGQLNINFGTQTICNPGSYLTISTGSTSTVTTSTSDFTSVQPFSNINNGVFNFGNANAYNPVTHTQVGTFNSITAVLINAGGVAAQKAAVITVYSASESSPVPSGTGTGVGTLHRS